jgi:hypothetical protein
MHKISAAFSPAGFAVVRPGRSAASKRLLSDVLANDRARKRIGHVNDPDGELLKPFTVVSLLHGVSVLSFQFSLFASRRYRSDAGM